MKGQESTVMMYLVWAVFFLAAAGAIYYIYSNNIKTSTPTPYPQMMDTIRAAVEGSRSGITMPVCIRLNVPNPVYVTKEAIENALKYRGTISFECRGACEATSDYLEIKGGEGRFCAEVNNNGLVVSWTR